jgi:hypothetical protein
MAHHGRDARLRSSASRAYRLEHPLDALKQTT